MLEPCNSFRQQGSSGTLLSGYKRLRTPGLISLHGVFSHLAAPNSQIRLTFEQPFC